MNSEQKINDLANAISKLNATVRETLQMHIEASKGRQSLASVLENVIDGCTILNVRLLSLEQRITEMERKGGIDLSQMFENKN